MKLFDKTTGKELKVGNVVKTFRGKNYILYGGRPPRHAASTGRVLVRRGPGTPVEEYFPGVINAEWKEEN